jgi:uncharacterized membrane protein YdjX (TVP38/TMEM64 family)
MSEAFPTIIYTLCFLTSSACAFLLARSFARTGMRLLLWSALCFLFLGLNNLVVIIDLLLVPQADFQLIRVALSLIGVSLLLFGLVWEAEEER